MDIYEIRIGEYYYVGSTKNSRKRKTNHLWKLKSHKHFNKFMQDVYDTHNDFNYKVLKSCISIDEMKRLEEATISEYKQKYDNKCMNVLSKYGGGSEWRNHKTEEELKLHDYNRTRLTPEARVQRNLKHSQTLQNMSKEEKDDWYSRSVKGRQDNIKSRKNYTPIKVEITFPSGEITIKEYDTEAEFFKGTSLEETSLRELKNNKEKIIKRRLYWTRHDYPVGTTLRLL